MRGLGTDHGISGPMRGLKKTASNGANKQTDRTTDGHGDSMTESTQCGRFSETKLSIDQYTALGNKYNVVQIVLLPDKCVD